MSRKDALVFLKRIAEDPDLMEKVKHAGRYGIIDIAKALGYSIILEELRVVLKEIKGEEIEPEGELSEEQLRMVVGGISTQEISNWTVDNIDKLGIIYDDLF